MVNWSEWQRLKIGDSARARRRYAREQAKRLIDEQKLRRDRLQQAETEGDGAAGSGCIEEKRP